MCANVVPRICFVFDELKPNESDDHVVSKQCDINALMMMAYSHATIQWLCENYISMPGADSGGGSFGSDEPPQRQRNFFEAILVARAAAFGEVNRLG